MYRPIACVYKLMVMPSRPPDDLTLGHVLAALTSFPAATMPMVLRHVVIDSRQATAGDLFVALPGERVDGHAYIGDAFQRGARAALVSRPAEAFAVVDCRPGAPPPPTWQPGPVQVWVEDSLTALQQVARYWRQQFSVRVVGITGSVGKTTTKELTAAVLAQRYSTLKSEGNYNNEIGLPLTLLSLRPRHARVVLEMGLYVQGDIALLCDIARPQVGVITLVGTVHLERIGTLEALIAGKRELVEALPADGVAILNGDEPLVIGMAPFTSARLVTYGLDSRADVWAEAIESAGLQGVHFTLHYGGEAARIHLPLLGQHSVHTALRAAAVGFTEGLTWREVIAGLETHRDQLRVVLAAGPRDSLMVDDTYNASPESTLAALNLLRDLDGRRLAVLGDMLELGFTEEVGHRLVGRRAAEVADVLVAVGPRGRIIGAEALAVGMAADRVHFAPDAASALPLLKELIQPRDVLLIKASRGLRLDQLTAALMVDELSGAG